MSRSALLSALTLFATLVATAGCRPTVHDPPPTRAVNVLLVTLDTTRASRMSCYGNQERTSPNFDALAEEGVRFDLAIAQASVTPVSHASILTGLNPYEHGVRVIFAAEAYRLPESVPTLATILSERGWRTSAFLSAFTVSEYFGLQRGFDEFDNGLDGAAEGRLTTDERGVASWVMRDNQRRSDETTDRFLDWLGQTEDPFFSWVHYWDPHDRLMLPPAEFLERFPPDGPSEDESRLAIYDAEISFMDAQFGRLVEGLKRRGLYEDTIVVVVADHGQGLGDHGWWRHRLLYQEQIRVPLLLKLPGGPAGRLVPELVRTIDIVPTVLEALGVPAPARIDGRSMQPLVDGTPDPPRVAYADALNLFDLNAKLLDERPNDGLLYCAMDADWKLIYRPRDPDASELYRLGDDPGELRDLYQPGHPEALRLLAELERMDGFVDEPFRPGEDREAMERLRSLGYAN